MAAKLITFFLNYGFGASNSNANRRLQEVDKIRRETVQVMEQLQSSYPEYDTSLYHWSRFLSFDIFNYILELSASPQGFESLFRIYSNVQPDFSVYERRIQMAGYVKQTFDRRV